MNVLVVKKLNAPPMMIVPPMKNVTIQEAHRERNVFLFVLRINVFLVPLAQPPTTKKIVCVDHL